MKIQYLAVIFIIITMPIVIVFSEFVNTQMEMVKTEQSFDSKLFDSTHDSIEAFQINTINSMYYTPESRVSNIEAAVNTFFNSLVTSFQYEGNLSTVMKEYVPAVVFTMYDGYYIYSPFSNTLTNVDTTTIDESYNKSVLSGLKPYVSYSCRYLYNGKEYIINYSMDNYIYVDIFDEENQKHEAQSGYLLSGVEKQGNNYKYDGILFEKANNERLRETISVKDDNDSNRIVKKEYYYVTLDGTKYYNKIFNNNSAYLYYKEAYEFTTWLLDTGSKVDIDGDGVKDLRTRACSIEGREYYWLTGR